MDEILNCDHLNESYMWKALFSSGAVHYVVQLNLDKMAIFINCDRLLQQIKLL